jgi:hypothetical protein
MAAPGLALVLALNMEIVPVGAPSTNDATAVPERTSLQQVPRLPVERSSLAYLTRAWGSSGGAVAQPDPEAALTFATRVQPPVRTAETDVSEPAPTTELRLVIRPLQTHDPGPIRSPAAIEREGNPPELIDSEAGLPS